MKTYGTYAYARDAIIAEHNAYQLGWRSLRTVIEQSGSGNQTYTLLGLPPAGVIANTLAAIAAEWTALQTTPGAMLRWVRMRDAG